MTKTNLNQYPMGPTVRKFLGISPSDYVGGESQAPNAELDLFFRESVVARLSSPLELAASELTDFIEELTAMDMPELALRVFDSYKEFLAADDFRALLSLGNAAMSTGQLALAEHFFQSAQIVAPSEPAPYVNLVQMYLFDQRLDEAHSWSVAGLKSAPNFRRLWSHYWQLLESTLPTPELARAQLERSAREFSSWAGFSLLAELESPGDAARQVLRLADFMSAYALDADFLIEYTGALGNAGFTDQIPGIIWSTEKLFGVSKLPWQLNLHAAQAHLHMNNLPLFHAYVTKVEMDSSAPQDLVSHLNELKKEADETAATEGLQTSTQPSNTPI